jgi:hypothetical protein
MTLLDDLEKYSERVKGEIAENAGKTPGKLNIVLPDWWDPKAQLSQPGSTHEPSRLMYFSEAFIA